MAKTRKRNERVLAYLAEVHAFLRANGAKSWNELYPDKPSKALRGDEKDPKPKTPEKKMTTLPDPEVPRLFKFERIALYSYRSAPPVAEHNYERHRQLFHACWTGDSKLIQALCLPKHHSKHGKDEDPIAITVTAKAPYAPLMARGEGYTPFAVALQARRWDTCRVILAIATAQHKKPEEKEREYSTRGIDLGESNIFFFFDPKSFA